jgi:D-amino peptidase
MVRVYISVDMEGVAGISHANPTRRGDYGYAQAVELMVGEANAAIEGAFDGGATAVTVNDSHGGMYNLTPEALDRRARVVLGKKQLSMN